MQCLTYTVFFKSIDFFLKRTRSRLINSLDKIVEFSWQLISSDFRLGSYQKQAFDKVFKLSDIPWP